MSSGSSRPPDAPDPQMLINAQTQANRVNQIGPYGTSTFSTDENGQATQTNTLSPQLQQVMQRVFQQAGQQPEQAQRWNLPPGFDQLMGAVGNRVGQNYGMSSQAKPSQQPPQQPTMKG